MQKKVQRVLASKSKVAYTICKDLESLRMFELVLQRRNAYFSRFFQAGGGCKKGFKRLCYRRQQKEEIKKNE